MISIILFLIIIFILLGYQFFFKPWHPDLPNQLKKTNFFYYGHRGAPYIAPENTLISFQEAIDYNIDGLELDVQFSKDKELIIYHDEYINFNNQEINISKLDVQDIKKINVNNKFSDIDPQFIPKLEDVIGILPNNILLNIEIKSYKYSNSHLITKKIIELTTTKSINNQIIISSFNPFIIKQIKSINPYISTAFIWSRKSYFHYKLFSYYAKPDAFHVNINDISADMVKWFKNKNINIYAYTVNNQSDLDKAKRYGLQGIFTDKPDIKNV